MAHPSSHDTLPSALSSLFESPHHHFLPAGGDENDILIDPSLEDAAAAVAVAQPPVSESVPHADTDVNVDAAAAAAATALELAESDAGADVKHDDNRKTRGTRRSDPNALEVTLMSLRGENDRLRKMIAALEGTIMPGPTDLDGDDIIAQNTLRELATAAVSSGELAGFGFESLQQHLEQQAHQLDVPEPSLSGVGDIGGGIGGEDGPSEGTAADFLHGLVTQVTEAQPLPHAESDPFWITRVALENEIAATRALIAAKESEISAFRDGTVALPIIEPVDRAQLDAQVAKTATALDASRNKAAVLRDIAERIEENRLALELEVSEKRDELAASFVHDGEESGDGHRALVEVRSYLEGVLKLWKDKGALPPAPLPSFPMLLRAEGNLQPPPSTLPKKRGRPARSTQKPSVVPAALAHLVPDTETVRQREKDMPIRRKGIKRNKVELEREKQREEEEGEMLRSLVGIGVWTREPGYVEGELEA